MRDSSRATRAPCSLGMLALIMHRPPTLPYGEELKSWPDADSPFSSRCSVSHSSSRSWASACCMSLVGREPSVPVERDARAARRRQPGRGGAGDVVGFLRGVRTSTVRSIVDNLRKAKVDPRIRAVLLKPTGFDSPFWGKVQEVRDAILDFKKSGKPVYAYLENGGDREYYLATAADKIYLMPSSLARPDRRRDLPGLPARHARQDRRVSGPAPHRRLQDRDQHVHREGLHARRTRRWTSRSTATCTNRSSRGIADGRKKTEADVRALIDRGSVPARRRARGRAGGRRAVRGSGGREAPRRGRRRAMWTATTTRASAGRRSA